MAVRLKGSLCRRYRRLATLLRHPLKGDCQQKTPIHRKPISLFAGLPLWVQRQPLSGPHPVFLLFVDLQPGTHQDQGRSRRENRWLRSNQPLFE
jgi:hypothetical protein